MKRAVFDASALLTFLHNRPGAARVSEIIQLGRVAKMQLSLSVVNWGEIYYSIWRDQGPGFARKVIQDLASLPIWLAPADLDQTRLAAELKAEHKLPYADCFAAALAMQRGAAVVTSDSDFASVARKVPILWAT